MCILFWYNYLYINTYILSKILCHEIACTQLIMTSWNYFHKLTVMFWVTQESFIYKRVSWMHWLYFGLFIKIKYWSVTSFWCTFSPYISMKIFLIQYFINWILYFSRYYTICVFQFLVKISCLNFKETLLQPMNFEI